MSMPLATRAFLLLNLLVFAAQVYLDLPLVRTFALWPPASAHYAAAPSFEVWQLLTYGFLHGGFGHLFFNMFALWMFGSDIERLLGTRRYVGYYLTCVVGAGLAQLFVVANSGMPPVPTVGASGGVFGLLLAFGMAFPRRRIMLLFPPIPMPAWLFVTLYGILELYLGVTGSGQGVAHFAHLGGMVAGYVLLTYWRSQARAGRGGGA
jgi:membrane associated rhomboid family serine protease